MFSSTPFEGGFGVEVTGIDLDSCLAPDVVDALRRTFFEHQFMVIRDQQITAQTFLRFAQRFGRPQPHILAHLRHREVPEVLPLSNIFRDGKPIGVFDGAAFWHQDMAYEDVPSNVTLVHALTVPDSGGETQFADMRGAYERLDAETQRSLAGLRARHRYGNRADEDSRTRQKAMELTEEEQKQVHDVYHPLVLEHPETGRPALYGVTSTSRGIEGMDDDEGVALLDRLAVHATDPDNGAARILSHRYRVGDVVLWDNLSLAHRATLLDRASGPGTERYMHRISVKRLPAA